MQNTQVRTESRTSCSLECTGTAGCIFLAAGEMEGRKGAPATSASALARRFSSSFMRRCASQSCMAATDLPPAAALDFLLICGLKLCTASCFFAVSAF